MSTLLDLSEAPEENLRRLIWLSGVKDKVKAELDAEYQRIYFTMRMEGTLDHAIDLGEHSITQIMTFTRNENEARGRQVRWNDRRG